MESVCFSGPLMLILSPILATACAALTVLYRDAVKSRDAQILYLTGELSEAHKRLQIAGPLMEEATDEVRRVTRGRR